MLTEFEINRLAGKQLFALRQTLGISRAALGKEIGVSGQQIHKYEIGLNRLNVDKLYRLAALFQVPPGAFFPDNPTKPHEPLPPASTRLIKMMNKISEEHHESLYAILRELVRIIQQSEAEAKP